MEPHGCHGWCRVSCRVLLRVVSAGGAADREVRQADLLGVGWVRVVGGRQRADGRFLLVQEFSNQARAKPSTRLSPAPTSPTMPLATRHAPRAQLPYADPAAECCCPPPVY